MLADSPRWPELPAVRRQCSRSPAAALPALKAGFTERHNTHPAYTQFLNKATARTRPTLVMECPAHAGGLFGSSFKQRHTIDSAVACRCTASATLPLDWFGA